MRRPAAPALAAIALALALGACGTSDETTPVACLEGSKAYLRALEDAPELGQASGRDPDQRLPDEEPGRRRAGDDRGLRW